MKVIFGSGIVGLLAKLILGDEWKVIPFYKSRFFSFNPPLDDNFVIADDTIEPFIKQLLKLNSKPTIFQYRRAWSKSGNILRRYDDSLCGDWLYKIFGQHVPPQSVPYFNNRMDVGVYDIRVNGLYSQLVNEYLDELKSEVAKGQVSEIGDHYFVRNGVKEEFEHAISTIPLPALAKLAKKPEQNLQAKTLHYFHIGTEALDFEGANQLLATDMSMSFYKAVAVAKGRYLFYCHEDIPNPGIYFMQFMDKFDIIDGTSIENAMPIGPIPKMTWPDNYGIYTVGSFAQWDWCMDVGSCILRLIRYANRGLKPLTPQPYKL